MKKLLYPLFALLILFTVGCGDDDATDDATDDTNPLVGGWEMNHSLILVEINPPQEFLVFSEPMYNDEIMILAEDGTYSSSGTFFGESFSDSGSWSSTSDQLTIVESDYSYIDGGDGIPLIYDFSITDSLQYFSGSVLTLIGSDTDVDGNNMVITTTYTIY